MKTQKPARISPPFSSKTNSKNYKKDNRNITPTSHSLSRKSKREESALFSLARCPFSLSRVSIFPELNSSSQVVGGDEMGGQEGTSGAGGTDEREGKNHCWVGFATGDDVGEASSSGASENVITYKRRKKMVGSSSESFYQRLIEGSANKPAERTVKEPVSSPCNHVSRNGSTIDSDQQSRTFILRLMHHSLKSDDGGIKKCIQDALVMAESDSYDRQGCKASSPTACMLKGDTFDTISSFTCNEGPHTESSTNTERCRRAFLKIILSENFSRLCKLLFENFQGAKAENLFGLSLIDRRMREGAYERMPLLFSSDIQQLCKELQHIGAELVSLSKSLQDVSTVCFNARIGGLAPCYSKDVKHKSCYQKCDSHGKPERMEGRVVHQVHACRHCGGKADMRDCLVCDACEEMYHVFCIEPAISDIPPSWYCVSCTASGFGTESLHENCVVCERLVASRAQLKLTRGTTLLVDEDNFNDLEDNSSYGMNEQMPGSSVSACKLCENEVEDGDEIKICEHDSCPYKYFHVRCLAKKQLKLHGPRWYCPSCLCRTCLTDKDDNKIILCESCDNAYHIYCLTPPQSSIPQGKWFCRQCQLKLRMIHNAKKAYEELELRRKSEQDSEKGRGGMDMLLSAVLNSEEGSLASNQTKM